MKQVLMVGVLLGAVTLVETSRAQHVPESIEAISSQSTTLEGCLRPGEREGEFSFTGASGTYAVVPGTGVNLTAHLNHLVQVTGTVEKSTKGSVLHASAVKMVSAACSAA